MKYSQVISDKLAIGLSLLCTVHCLLLPVILVFLPSLSALGLENEQFHLWLVIVATPTSIYALTLGCRQHRCYYLLGLGLTGICLLISALLFGELILGGYGEKLFTVIGTTCIAIGHCFNYSYCRQSKTEPCECPGTN